MSTQFRPENFAEQPIINGKIPECTEHNNFSLKFYCRECLLTYLFCILCNLYTLEKVILLLKSRNEDFDY